MTMILVGVVIVFFVVVIVAVLLGKDVKAAVKVWFASISVEVTGDRSKHE
jgi:hypothetical protein